MDGLNGALIQWHSIHGGESNWDVNVANIGRMGKVVDKLGDAEETGLAEDKLS